MHGSSGYGVDWTVPTDPGICKSIVMMAFWQDPVDVGNSVVIWSHVGKPG